jgi:hypothetical protein
MIEEFKKKRTATKVKRRSVLFIPFYSSFNCDIMDGDD